MATPITHGFYTLSAPCLILPTNLEPREGANVGSLRKFFSQNQCVCRLCGCEQLTNMHVKGGGMGSNDTFGQILTIIGSQKGGPFMLGFQVIGTIRNVPESQVGWKNIQIRLNYILQYTTNDKLNQIVGCGNTQPYKLGHMWDTIRGQIHRCGGES